MATDTAGWIGLDLLGGRFRVTAKLGEGGMAFVYRARDRQLDRDVVIKVPRRAMLEDPQFAGRFLREVRSLSRLAHPHVVKVIDVGEHEGTPFTILEYLTGGSLRDRQKVDAAGRHVPAPPAELHGWLRGVAAALDYIHGQNYIHRDVKPDNILFDAHGHVYLSDFGIAKVVAAGPATNHTVLTGTGMVLGTAQYMAPELILGEPYDSRVDQYALAATVYELLAGRVPVDGATPAAIVVQQVKQAPRLLNVLCPSISPALAAAVQRALSREPDRRYPSCMAFAEAVLAEGHPAPTTAAPKQPARAVPGAEASTRRPCPRCGERLQLVDRDADKCFRCPRCKAEFSARPKAAGGREAKSAATVGTAPTAQATTEPYEAPRRRSAPQARRDRPGAWPPWAIPAAVGGGTLLAVVVVMVVSVAWLWRFPHKASTSSLASHGGGAALVPDPEPPANPFREDPLPGEPPNADPAMPAAVPPAPPRAPERTLVNSIGMKLALIPAGRFKMGSPATEVGRSDDESLPHDVRITKPFYLGVYHVTQEEYEKVMGENPSWFAGNGGGKEAVADVDTTRFPVENVTWEDAQMFCDKLSGDVTELLAGRVYRLPTEAEWEYACRAGTRTAFHQGNSLSSDQANFDGRFDAALLPLPVMSSRPCRVGSYPANRFGLFDMHGNVQQWCADWYGAEVALEGLVKDPQGPEEGKERVRRGGSWSMFGRECRSAARASGAPDMMDNQTGFRVAVTVVP